MKNNVLLISILIFISLNLLAQQIEENGFNDQSTQSNIYFTQTDVRTLADKNLNSVISLYSGVDFIRNNLYIRGSFPEANVYMIDGFPFNSYDKDAAFHLPFQSWESISLSKGNSNTQFGFGENFINQNIKNVGDEILFDVEYLTDNISFKSMGDAFDGQKRLGSHWFGYSNFNASLSAPIYEDKIKFFSNINYRFERDKNPQNYPGINLGNIVDSVNGTAINLKYPAGSLLKNSLQNINYTGKLFFDFEPVQFTLSGHYSDQIQYDPIQSGIISNFMNPFRTEEENIKKWFINAGFTHKLSNEFSYSINGSYSSFLKKEYDPILKDNFLGYGDSLANANTGLFEDYDVTPWRGSYTQPRDRSIFSFRFNEPGSIVANYAKFSDKRLCLRGTINIVLFKNHFLSAGLEYDKHTIRKFSLSNDNLVGLPGYIASVNTMPDDYPKPTMEEIFKGRGFNNIGYDFYGNETDGSNDQDYFGAPEPSVLSFFIQDDFKYGDFSFSFGGRIDNFDFGSWRLKTPEMPEESINRNTGEILEGGFIQSGSKLIFSPRFSTSYNFNNELSVSFSAGKYYYSPNLYSLYEGAYSIVHQLRQNSFFSVDGFIIKDAEPVSSTIIELSGNYSLSWLGKINATLFYKKNNNIPSFAQQNTLPTSYFESYYSRSQGPSYELKGIELNFHLKLFKSLILNGSLTYQPNEEIAIKFPVGPPLNNIVMATTGEFEQVEVKSTLQIGYKIVNKHNPFLNRFGISARMIYNDGRLAFLRASNIDLEGDARDRSPKQYFDVLFLPSFFQINLKIDKSISISNLIDLNIYFDVINLFDTKNILEIFVRTGNDYDDGVLSDPERLAQFINTYGEIYPDIYAAIRLDYKEQTLGSFNEQYGTEVFYGPPRQIRFGIRLEY
jgi:hypothetical protein